MTLPRPVLIAILGLALCAAAFLATRSANDTGTGVTSVEPAPQPAPVTNHKAAKPAKPVHAAKPAHAAKPHKAAPMQPATAAEQAAAAATPQATSKPATLTPAKPAVAPKVALTIGTRLQSADSERRVKVRFVESKLLVAWGK